jgi:hypothetical protein
MIFSIAKKNFFQYPFEIRLGNEWNLYSWHEINDQKTFGYKIDHIGGNFLEFALLDLEATIKFSFFKDFDVYQDLDNGILLSNDPRHCKGSILHDIIEFRVNGDGSSCVFYDWRSFKISADTSKTAMIFNIKQKLISNLMQCRPDAGSAMKIAFSGGLDSGTLAFLAHDLGLDFVCVISKEHEFLCENLPFRNITLSNLSTKVDAWGDALDIKQHFYHADMNHCITGFFGDCTMMHNNTLYYQCEKWCDSSTQIYDRQADHNVPVFTTKGQILLAMIKILRSTRFRHYFDNFLIVDPYRDPEITKLLMNMTWPDLISQFGSAWIQREIIAGMNVSWLDLLCRYKNEYKKN